MEARKWKIGITQLAGLLTLARGRIAAASILIAAVLGIYIMRLGWLQLIEPHRPVQGACIRFFSVPLYSGNEASCSMTAGGDPGSQRPSLHRSGRAGRRLVPRSSRFDTI